MRKLAYIATIVIFTQYLCLAQQEVIDSLFKLKEGLQGTNEEKFEWLISAHRFFLNHSRISLNSFLDEAELLASKLGDKQAAALHNERGVALAFDDNFISAQKEFYLAKELYGKAQDKTGIAKAINNLAGIYRESGYLNKSASLIKESINIFIEIKDTVGFAKSLASLALVYIDLKQYDSSIVLARQSINLFNQLKDSNLSYIPLQNLAKSYLAKNNCNKAIGLIKKAIDKIVECKHYANLPNSYIDLIKCYLQTSKIDSALDAVLFFDEAIVKYNLAKTHAHISKKYLSEIYERKGDLHKSLQFMKIADSLQTEYYENYKYDKINTLRSIHEKEDNQKELTIKKIELREKQIRLYWLYSVLGAVVTLGGILFRHDRKQTLLSRELTKLNLELAKSLKEKSELAQEYHALNETLEQTVRERTAKLIKALETLSEMAFINAHKTRASSARLQGLFYIHQENWLSTEELIAYSKQTLKEMDEVIREISLKLYQIRNDLENWAE